MFRSGPWVASFAVAAVVAWAGLSLTAQESKPDARGAKDAKPVDLSALREAVASASKRGENVDEVRTALDALEKAQPMARAGRVPPELQALRDAVDAAARKGENVEAIAKELLAVEMTIAGRSLAKPKPEPRPDPNPAPVPFPNVPFPIRPNPGLGAGAVDIEMFNKAMELRKKAIEMLAQNPRDPDARKEMQKLLAEANDLMLKAVGGGAGGMAPLLPGFPDVGRVPERARLGIRMDHVPAIAVEQLGLEPNTGIAVAFVSPGSAAEKAGLKVHDIILEFAGKPVTDDTEDFVRRVTDAKAGEKIDIVVLRKGKKVDVKGVELPDMARPVAPPRVRPLPAQPLVPPIRNAGAFDALAALPAGFTSVSLENLDRAFALKATKGGVKFSLSGTRDDAGRPTLRQTVIERDGKTQTIDETATPPADILPDVQALLKYIETVK